ncbi:tetratricopeptide repeat protein [Psychrosphaera sp. F3M07]|jgi:predicted negative regulator of RcsB-dependent stress response|uniref:YfgM family protein n=1 Tax=Psychrosphaera sp. F3M07 TaxID=2841560 RepID=UPI001C08102D|nr:tetratricopeptide repeat protein [Psychrosphaera sp. F3M07]MBU2917866.1 tetratricopeptide repeat protein [Psychrosphaera sp. F3M07]
MEVYSTEEQQVEAIKSFWKENGTQIVLGAALGLGGFSAWNWYVDNQIAEQEAASAQYEEFIKVSQSENANSESVESELKAFTAAYGESGYGVFVQLLAAKQAVTDGKFELAATNLTTALSLTDSVSLKDLVSLRLARIQSELQQYDAALKTLTSVKSKGYEVRVAELTGDVYLAQGNKDKARMSYQSAADNGGLEGNNLLKMKLDDLALSSKTTS